MTPYERVRRHELVESCTADGIGIAHLNLEGAQCITQGYDMEMAEQALFLAVGLIAHAVIRAGVLCVPWTAAFKRDNGEYACDAKTWLQQRLASCKEGNHATAVDQLLARLSSAVMEEVRLDKNCCSVHSYYLS